MNSTRISHAQLKVTESFSVSQTHSWLSWCNGYDSWPRISRLWVQIQHRSFNFFGKKKPSLISLILNAKSEKHDWNKCLIEMSFSIEISFVVLSVWLELHKTRMRVCPLQTLAKILVSNTYVLLMSFIECIVKIRNSEEFSKQFRNNSIKGFQCATSMH